jgi:hypothetical protein
MIGIAAQARAAIVVDGVPDEPEWQQAQVFDQFVVTEPYTLGPPRYPTQARMLGTPQGIAIAFVVEQPAGVPRQHTHTARDADIPGDRVNVWIDFDADGVIAYNFTVGLTGAQQDATVTSETHYSNDWDGDWQSAVAETAQGWSVEILIPWNVASMRGSDSPTRTVAVLFDRVLGATSERSASAPEGFTRARYVSNFPHLTIAQFRGASLHVFPYASVRQDFVNHKLEAKAGADLQWKPSGRFQLAAAINPDFGQVESDQLVVNFDAIETYFSDKRPFFTENQGPFNLPTPNAGELIYTRRIGGPADDGSGQAADIDAAIKVTGSGGALGYGVLAAVESDYAKDLGRAFYAQRFTYLAGPWNLGYLTTWTDRPLLDRSALVNAADATWRPSGSVLMATQVVASDIGVARESTRGMGAWWRLDLTPSGPWRHELQLAHFGANLDFNDMGYMPRNNYNMLDWFTEYTRASYPAESAINSTTWHFQPQVRYNDAGERLSTGLDLWRSDSLRSGTVFAAEWQPTSASVDDLISRGNGDVRLPPRQSLHLNFETPHRGDWKLTGGVLLLQEGLHGWAYQAEVGATYYAGDRLTLNGYLDPRWSDDWLIWQHDNQLATYRRDLLQTGINVDWFPAARHEFRAKIQWVAIDAGHATSYRIDPSGNLRPSNETIPSFTVKDFGLQLRYRWTFAPQSDLYVVYSRGGFAQEEGNHESIPVLINDATSLRDADQFLVKVSYRF